MAAAQPEAVLDVITFSFVGLETITGIILAVILLFLSVEKTVSRKQAVIRERQKSAAIARGEEWIEPEDRARLEEEEFLRESEEIFALELREKCDKNGLDYEKALKKHTTEAFAILWTASRRPFLRTISPRHGCTSPPAYFMKQS